MSATKILWGQILVVFAIVLASVWSATQWTAVALGHQSPAPTPEFAFDDTEATDNDAAIQRRMQRLARQASLDPGDGIQL